MKAMRGVDISESVDPAADAVADLDSLAPAASLFRSLGDPSRLAIVGHLAIGEHKVRELTEHLGLAQSTVSAHLRCLLDCGLVQVRAVGRASVYSLAVEDEVLDVLRSAEALLAATGDAVVLCPRYGRGPRR
jgi:DNA-binding transcriptional ArsR family regulator